MTTGIQFPDDENGEVLRKMQERGDDLSKPRDMDFFFEFETEAEARGFAEQVHVTTGLSAKTSRYDQRKTWQVNVVKNMIPTHFEITALENSLTQIAKLYNGQPDGWGSFAQKDD